MPPFDAFLLAGASAGTILIGLAWMVIHLDRKVAKQDASRR